MGDELELTDSSISERNSIRVRQRQHMRGDGVNDPR